MNAQCENCQKEIPECTAEEQEAVNAIGGWVECDDCHEWGIAEWKRIEAEIETEERNRRRRMTQEPNNPPTCRMIDNNRI